MYAGTARKLMVVTDQTGISDQSFREFFQKSPVGRMIISVEPDGRLVYADLNTSAASYFEMTREGMLGKTPADLFEGAVAEQIEQSFLSCIRSKRPVTFNALPRFPGGVRVQAFILNPLLDTEGRVRYIDVMARPDMVDSAQLQRERDDAIMLLTSLFDASGFGIIVTDHHGRIVRVNDAFLGAYGWAREDLLGEEFTIIVTPEERAISRKLHAAFVDRGKHGSRELQILRKDGDIADIVVTTALLEMSQKRRFLVSTIRDVSERKNMVRNLKRAKEGADSANKAKSAFLANMSHELRTPLNAVIGFTELMRNQTFGAINNPKYEEYLGDIHFSARHLLDIINDVLDMSKIEAGKVDLVESEIVISDVLESILRIMNDRAQAAGVILDFYVADNIPHIKADQRMLRQILINLVSNAIKFSVTGQSVKVRVATGEDQHVIFIVEDEGCGIPSDKLGTVMEPFGQANSDPRYYKGQGTGLGLPLARAMVDMHDGTLRLDSEEGKGTRVYIDFPASRTLNTRE